MEKISNFNPGVDLGERQSVVRDIDPGGDMIEQLRVATNKKAFKKLTITLDSCDHSTMH